MAAGAAFVAAGAAFFVVGAALAGAAFVVAGAAFVAAGAAFFAAGAAFVAAGAAFVAAGAAFFAAGAAFVAGTAFVAGAALFAAVGACTSTPWSLSAPRIALRRTALRTPASVRAAANASLETWPLVLPRLRRVCNAVCENSLGRLGTGAGLFEVTGGTDYLS